MCTSSLNHRVGIPCQESDYTLEEMERVHDTLNKYQMVGVYAITTSTPYST